MLVVVEEVKMLNKREEKGCKGNKYVMEINVQCAESLQVHANNGRLIKKIQVPLKKDWRLLNKKNEVEGTSPNKKAKV